MESKKQSSLEAVYERLATIKTPDSDDRRHISVNH